MQKLKYIDNMKHTSKTTASESKHNIKSEIAAAATHFLEEQVPINIGTDEHEKNRSELTYIHTEESYAYSNLGDTDLQIKVSIQIKQHTNTNSL